MQMTLVKYELTAGAPCPALTGEPWDVYVELYEDIAPRFIGIGYMWVRHAVDLYLLVFAHYQYIYVH